MAERMSSFNQGANGLLTVVVTTGAQRSRQLVRMSNWASTSSVKGKLLSAGSAVRRALHRLSLLREVLVTGNLLGLVILIVAVI